jgi:hypothetical protein
MDRRHGIGGFDGDLREEIDLDCEDNVGKELHVLDEATNCEALRKRGAAVDCLRTAEQTGRDCRKDAIGCGYGKKGPAMDETMAIPTRGCDDEPRPQMGSITGDMKATYDRREVLQKCQASSYNIRFLAF